jgi:divalent metal cation (Fe/Co/Zn/Cd) transporter
VTTLAWLSISVSFVCALFICFDELRRPQRMAVMNVVWPVTALYFNVFALWAYFAFGRTRQTDTQALPAKTSSGRSDEERGGSPFTVQVALATSHCGAGCMIADVLTEFAIAGAGLTLFGSPLWTSYLLDFAAAWLLGIIFQYFALRPMRHDLNPLQAVWAAIKADTLSIVAFQVGMYAFMAWVYFRLFPAPHLTPFDPRYWLMMQAAMICGFATSFPMNRVLIGVGLKEKM